MVPPVLIHQPWIIPPPPHCFVRFILRRVLSRFPPRSLEVKLPSSSHPQLLPCPRQTSSVLLAALSIIFAPPPLLSENELKLQQPRLINGAPKFREVKAEVQTQMGLSDSRWSVAESLFLPPPILPAVALASPWGSTSFDSFRASELARSVLAGVTAKIRQLSLVMNCMIISRICCSMSAGWSPTGTLVIPGKSMRVKLSTSSGGRTPNENRERHLER